MTPPNYKPSKQTKNDPPNYKPSKQTKNDPPNYKPSKQTKNDPPNYKPSKQTKNDPPNYKPSKQTKIKQIQQHSWWVGPFKGGEPGPNHGESLALIPVKPGPNPSKTWP